MQKTTLDNGFEIYTESIDISKTVTFSIYIKTGSYNETNHFGIAHVLEHMVFKGTDKRTVRQINEEIEDYGGYMNAETNFEYTRYFATIPFENWKIAGDLISDIVLNPIFPENEVTLEKKVIQEELKMYSDDASSHVYDMLFEAMHPSYKNRQSIGGTVESVGNISRDDIIEFKDKFYQPNNMFAVVTGNVSHDEVVEFLTNTFGDKTNNSTLEEDTSFEPDILNSDTTTLKRHIDQVHYAWGLFAPPANHEDAIVAEVITTILSSRLYRLVREERGLCYTISVGYMGLKDNGIIMGYSGLEKSCLEDVKEIILEQFESLRTEKVDEKEFKRAIEKSKGSHIIQFEKLSAINSYIGSGVIQNTSLEPDEYITELSSVKIEDLQRFARNYFTPDNWQFVQIIPN